MQITIRRGMPDDAAAMAQQMSAPEVFSGLLQMPYPTEALWRQQLEALNAPGKPDLLLVAVRDVDGVVVGSAGLHPAGSALRRRHAMFLGISVSTPAQRQGVGQALITALLDYADNWAQVLRLELNVYADNAPAVRLYERCGFSVEGRMSAYAMRDGVYVDSLAMAAAPEAAYPAFTDQIGLNWRWLSTAPSTSSAPPWRASFAACEPCGAAALLLRVASTLFSRLPVITRRASLTTSLAWVGALGSSRASVSETIARNELRCCMKAYSFVLSIRASITKHAGSLQRQAMNCASPRRDDCHRR